MTFLSPAKLNLGLKVTGKRSDGYHLLKTIFCLIDLFDEIQIQTTDNGKISIIEHKQAWPYYTDLAYKAAKMLQDITNTKLGANIKINKTIPSGGGLGGGSSNAATVLIVLNNLWQTNLSISELIEIGSKLGADVPFFIYGRNAVATGIGEVFTDYSIPQQYFVLVCQSFHLNTENVFKNYSDTDSQTLPQTEDLLNSLENDLLPAAIKLKPELGKIYEKLKPFGQVAMTGSGSTLFLRFTDQEEAKKVVKKIAELNENKYNTFLVKSIAVSPLSTNNF